MKRGLTGILTAGFVALAMLGLPRLAHAQYGSDSDFDNGPLPYNDVENGQLLQVFSYAIAPIGYALEWGVTRPLHSLATDSVIAPVIGGNQEIQYFGENANAEKLPPATFAPFQMPVNPNLLEPDTAPSLQYHESRVQPLKHTAGGIETSIQPVIEGQPQQSPR